MTKGDLIMVGPAVTLDDDVTATGCKMLPLGSAICGIMMGTPPVGLIMVGILMALMIPP